VIAQTIFDQHLRFGCTLLYIRIDACPDIGANDAFEARSHPHILLRGAATLLEGTVEHHQPLFLIENGKAFRHGVERSVEALAEQDLLTVAAAGQQAAQEKRITRAAALVRDGDHMRCRIEERAIVVAEGKGVRILAAGRSIAGKDRRGGQPVDDG
jgi:hypothetical protein